MANRIVLNNISYHGKGAIKEIVNEAKARGFQHIFVCTDPDLLKFGVTKKVTDLLDEAGIDAVKQLSKDVGIPENLAGKIKEEDLDQLAKDALADACCPGNPRDTNLEDLKALYRKIM